MPTAVRTGSRVVKTAIPWIDWSVWCGRPWFESTPVLKLSQAIAHKGSFVTTGGQYGPGASSEASGQCSNIRPPSCVSPEGWWFTTRNDRSRGYALGERGLPLGLKDCGVVSKSALVIDGSSWSRVLLKWVEGKGSSPLGPRRSPLSTDVPLRSELTRVWGLPTWSCVVCDQVRRSDLRWILQSPQPVAIGYWLWGGSARGIRAQDLSSNCDTEGMELPT